MLLLLAACHPDDPTPSLRCGEGTVAVDGVCLPEASTGEGYSCGTGTVPRGTECVPVEVQDLWLPFEPGLTTTVIQGAHGSFSHNGYGAFAVDFDVPEGTPVVAAREGVVQWVREDSDSGCGDVECADQANVVFVDHGDGTVAKYYHLRQDGALVEPGDVVARGQPIAESGNTGFSTGPHLHLEVDDLFYQSQPMRFADVAENEGQAFAGLTVTSANEEQAPPEAVPFSSCPAELYGFLGVTLDSDVPCSVAARDETYALRGTAWGPDGLLMIALWSTSQGWDYECEAVGDDGRFDTEIRWSGRYDPFGYFVLASASTGCYSAQGWDTSPFVVVAG